MIFCTRAWRRRWESGSPGRTRTCDLAVNSRSLYQLSYRGTFLILAAEPGLEPGLRDSKSLVLPLHYSAALGSMALAMIGLVPKAGLEPARELPPNSF